ncbi:lysoplasmalogenase family protein [Corynebacterium variabile]|uniref:lysoplasmalogenase family protein n=1 Tax=Corynebacterium variabile TaxID=1727 RepID=UPI0028A948FD|nr:lysoplasmalogenase family protein [Corynebacterium variabile]
MSTARALRTAYLAAGAVSVVAAAAGRRGDRLTRIVKPTLMPLLAGTVLARGQRKGADGRSDDSRVRARNLNRGSAAFALNQVSYIAELWRTGHRPRKITVALRAPVLASGVVTAATGAPAALPAAVGYGSLLAGTSVLAAEEGETTPLGLGGNLFVLSDGLILARQAFLTGEKPVIRVLDGLVDGLVMATYVAAQLLLVEGLTGKPTRG